MAVPLASKKPRRWPRRVLGVVLFVVLESAAFVTLGSLLSLVIEASWARWLGSLAASLGVPLLLAAVIAGRVREERALAVLGWGLLVVLLLGAGVPWLLAHDATRQAVARHGLFAAEQVAGPLSAKTRERWERFFLGTNSAVTPAATPVHPGGRPPAGPSPVPPPPAAR
jgi:hypothetical protein